MALYSACMASRESGHRREGKALLGVWLELEILAEIDRCVAEQQAGRVEKVHRSDVVRQVLVNWMHTRRGDAGGQQ